jgi:hypothetical protein
MESEKKRAARDKVVSKASTWLDCRNAKAASTGAAKQAAQSEQRKAEHELAEAVEKYKKVEN